MDDLKENCKKLMFEGELTISRIALDTIIAYISYLIKNMRWYHGK